MVAIEPFATDGPGHVTEEGAPRSSGSTPPSPSTGAPHRATWWRRSARLRGLPFARRQLGRFAAPAVEDTLAWLKRRGRLTAYPPLVERSGRPVAQAEHTIYVGRGRVEVLTR